jgi:hypothetical protein
MSIEGPAIYGRDFSNAMFFICLSLFSFEPAAYLFFLSRARN